MSWYYSDGEKSIGPIREEYLHVLVSSGQLHKGTMVCPDESGAWMAYEQAFPNQTASTVPAQRHVASNSKIFIGVSLAIGAAAVLLLGILIGITRRNPANPIAQDALPKPSATIAEHAPERRASSASGEQDLASNLKQNGQRERYLIILSAMEKMVKGGHASTALYWLNVGDLEARRITREKFLAQLTGELIEPVADFDEGINGLKDWQSKYPDIAGLIGRLIESAKKRREAYLSISEHVQSGNVSRSEGEQALKEAEQLLDQCGREVESLVNLLNQ